MKCPCIFCLFFLGLVSGDMESTRCKFGNDLNNPLVIQTGSVTKLVLQLSKCADQSYTAIIPSSLENYIGVAIQTKCLSVKDVKCGKANIGLFHLKWEDGVVLSPNAEEIVFDYVKTRFHFFQINDPEKPLILKYSKTNSDPEYEGAVTFHIITLSTENKNENDILVKYKNEPKILYALCSKNYTDVFNSVNSTDYKVDFERCTKSIDDDNSSGSTNARDPGKADSSKATIIGFIVVALVIVGVIVGIVIFMKKRKRRTTQKDVDDTGEKGGKKPLNTEDVDDTGEKLLNKKDSASTGQGTTGNTTNFTGQGTTGNTTNVDDTGEKLLNKKDEEIKSLNNPTV